LSRKAYLEFLEAFFVLLKQNVKKTTRMAFINADWWDFQNTPAAEEKYTGRYQQVCDRPGSIVVTSILT